MERAEAKSAILNEGRIIFYPSNRPGSAKCVLELAVYRLVEMKLILHVNAMD